MSQNSLMVVQVVCHEVERFKITKKKKGMFFLSFFLMNLTSFSWSY